MNEDRARLILNAWRGMIQEDGSLYSSGAYLAWNLDDKEAVLDGRFTPEELEAIAFWMRLKGGQG